MEATNSRVFRARFLNKPTIFVGSNKITREILKEKSHFLEFGYKSFMYEIYGDNILFKDGDSAKVLREMLTQLFTSEAVSTYKEAINRIVDKTLLNLSTSEPLCIYKCLKQLSTELCLSLFLGLDFSGEEAAIITELTTTHWHGIISVPVAIKVPGMTQSMFHKALEAKRRLLAIIEQRRAEKCHRFIQHLESFPEADDTTVNHHLLLLTSALVPKALSSILTSVLIQLGTSQYDHLQQQVLTDDNLLTHIMQEVLRLYPPFIGGLRHVKETFNVGGYRFPAGEAILYLTYMAHRDPEVFTSPDEFLPDRWTTLKAEDTLFMFGSGPRQCIGQELIWAILKTVIRGMLGRYHVTLEEGQDLTHKWLPVARPRSSVHVVLQPRGGQSVPADIPDTNAGKDAVVNCDAVTQCLKHEDNVYSGSDLPETKNAIIHPENEMLE